VFRMLKEKARISKELKQMREGRKANVEWIMNNRQELIGNFPNKWAAIDDGAIQLVDDDVARLCRLMQGRGGSSTLVYYHCTTIVPPMMLVRSEEVETNEFAFAEA